jgi:hypothetical protein
LKRAERVLVVVIPFDVLDVVTCAEPGSTVCGGSWATLQNWSRWKNWLGSSTW